MSNKIGRKITLFYVCPNHVSRFRSATRRQKAEAFCEGGPGRGLACSPYQPCRIWPGCDFFVASDCDSEADWPKTWTVNQNG